MVEENSNQAQHNDLVEIEVSIANKNFALKCEQDEIQIIKDATTQLQDLMSELNLQPNYSSALMIALNLSVELIKLKQTANQFADEIENDLIQLEQSIKRQDGKHKALQQDKSTLNSAVNTNDN